MFASFDGDDFEAVMRAARSEIAKDPPGADASAQQQPHATGGDSSSNSLYQSVCALRAAAMAAEAAKKRSPALKKRRTPLDDKQSGDAWMLQVPYAVADTQYSSTAAAVNTGASLELPSQHGLFVEGTGAEPARFSRFDKAYAAQLDLDAKAYVGMSCDSSSDGGQQLSSREAAAPSRGSLRAAASAASGSNNIVSSRALGSKLSAGQHVIAAAAVRASPMRSAAATATAVLELAPAAAQLSPWLYVSSPAAATRTADVQLLAGQQKQGSTGQMSGMAASAAAQGHQWSSSSTRSLRRALARLHSPLAPQ
jgi:hypothetical protein